MTESAFIEDDGYTETKFIKAVANLYPAVRIKFRPIPTTDQAVAIEKLQEIARKQGAKKAEEAMAEQIAKRVCLFEIVSDSGKVGPVFQPISASQLLKAKPPLFARLSSIVFYGTDGGDVDPFDSEATTTPANEQLEADLKN